MAHVFQATPPHQAEKNDDESSFAVPAPVPCVTLQGLYDIAHHFESSTPVENMMDLLVTKVRECVVAFENKRKECDGMEVDLLEADIRKNIAQLRLDEAVLLRKTAEVRLAQFKTEITAIGSVFDFCKINCNGPSRRDVFDYVNKSIQSVTAKLCATLALDATQSRVELNDFVMHTGRDMAPYEIETSVTDDSDSNASSGSSRSTDSGTRSSYTDSRSSSSSYSRK